MTDLIRDTSLRIGLVTGLAIILGKILSLLMVYNFFRFDVYLAIVAVSFLIVGYLLTDGYSPSAHNFVKSERSDLEEVKAILRGMSSRELSILKMIAAGHTNKEIAASLGVELSTVKTHVNNMYQKINAKNRNAAREKWNDWARLKLIS